MDRLIKNLDNIIFIFLCSLIFFLPISNAIIEICAASSIVLWLLKRILQRSFNRENILPKSCLNLPILLYLVILIFSVLQGGGISIGIKYLLRKTLEYLILYFVVIDTVNSGKRIKIILSVLLTSLLLISIDCIIQYFTGCEFLRQRRTHASRVAGPFDFPDKFGNYLVTILPLAAAFSLYKFKFRFFSHLLKILTFILIFLLFVNVTKGAWIGFLVSFVFFAIFYQRKKSLWFIPVFLLITFIILPYDFYSYVLFPFRLDNDSISQRFDLWQTGWNMFRDKPLLGQGLGMYMQNYHRFQLSRQRAPGEQGTWYAHNSYLQMLAETGVLGLLSFLLIIFIFLKRSFRLIRSYKNGYLFTFLLGATLGLSAYLVQIFFDSNFYYLSNSVLFWYILALLVSGMRLIEKESLIKERGGSGL